MAQFLATPGLTDAAAIADQLIGEFGSPIAALAASFERLTAVAGLTAARRLTSANDMLLHCLLPQPVDAPVFPDTGAVLAYLHVRLAGQTAEQVRALYLNAKHRLIHDEQASIGTLADVSFYSREVIRRALEVGAAALILVHNHPSGDPNPSARDIAATRHLAATARALDIVLLDHIIIASAGTVSLTALGHL